ncbi:MAG: 23S rRNA (adenine(2503)-C(2))-methyltransferase RlmN [Magnetococcales bacterium]|nr:23S rRNA (adenine(2503)-C(2))-methyltransferase RlmN [Magnetococcales bacterium]
MTTETSPVRLTGLTREELDLQLAAWGQKPFRGKQLWSWLHVKLATEVAGMTDLSKEFRELLGQRTAPLRPGVGRHQVARDGTEKWLLVLADGETVETVFIPDEERGTLCISSQVGCALSCPFCRTGTMPLVRNLTAAEMVEQVLHVRTVLSRAGQGEETGAEGGAGKTAGGGKASSGEEKRITNVVLMGMGEPLYNYEATVKAVRILMDRNGLAIGTRKITLSTSGVAPRIPQVMRDLGVNLAVSLHAVRDEVRDVLVPINRKFNLAALRQAIMDSPLKSGRRITWEYVLLDGINDSLEAAAELAAFVRGIPSKMNLIPFNPWEGSPYLPSPREQVVRFQEVLHHAGLVTVIRESRGADISAACGQLKSS